MSSLKSGTNGSEIKARNISAILINLLHNNGLSRVNLAEIIGVSTTTITNLVAELIEQGIVTEEGIVRSGSVGRPQMALQLRAQSRFALGIQIEAGRARIAITDIFARPIAKHQLDFSVSQAPHVILGQLTDIAHDMIAREKIDRRLLIGVGVVIPGLVDPQQGMVISSSQLGWEMLPLRSYFSSALKLPVGLDNNVRGMTLAEAMFGGAQSAKTMVFVYVRLGVGSGLIIDGRLFRGADAGAGEIGHTAVILEGGALCHCGNRGCLETLINEPAIIRLAETIRRDHPAGILAQHLNKKEGSVIENIFAAAREGDEPTRAMLKERAEYLGIALANLVNIVNPEMIVVGGIFAKGQDLLLPTVAETLASRAFAGLGRRVQIQATRFGDDSGIVGAAALALETFFYQQPSPTAESEAMW